MAAKTAASLDVGRRLRELREERGIPKERMALELSMSAENWRHYESGRNQLAVTMLPTIAALYGISLENLLLDLFELRVTAPARSDSDTTRHPETASDGRHERHYAHTDRRLGAKNFHTSRVLALA